MTQREKEPGGIGRLGFPHQLADEVIDGGDMVGIDGVSQAKDVGQEGGAEQGRPVGEGAPGPQPGSDIGEDQQHIKSHGFGQDLKRSVIK